MRNGGYPIVLGAILHPDLVLWGRGCASLAHDRSDVCTPLSLRTVKRLLLTNDAQIWVPEEPLAYGD